MDIVIDGQKITLNNQDTIGIGGEATVFKRGQEAVKIYLKPDVQREQKLRAMLPKTPTLPSTVISPQKLVLNQKRNPQVIGFTMRLLEGEYTEIRQLASRKYRATSGINTQAISQLFMTTGETLRQIHQAGMVVGDLNDLNLMFKGSELLFIDVDSFQFEQYPCAVGTEAFIDPLLYGVDLGAKPAFQPIHDWYSFAVLLFKSLLLSHPYGGVHPHVKLLTQRAHQKMSVFCADVIYPKIAYSLDLLSDDLANVFDQWFTQGHRGEFPLDQLQLYAASLRKCAFCGEPYPMQRARCPHCATLIPAATLAQASNARTLLRTTGKIVAWTIVDHEIRVICHEDGKAVLYTLTGERQTGRVELFNAIPNATYGFFDRYIIISPNIESDDLFIIDTDGGKAIGKTKTSTGLYGNRERVFATSTKALYRLSNGYLMRGEMRFDQWVEQAILAIVEGQTWLRVDPKRERIVGYFRIFNQYTYWLLNQGERIDLAVPELMSGEFLIEATVKFSESSLLLLRLTQLNGVEQIRLDEFNLHGNLLNSQIRQEIDLFNPLDSVTYATHQLLFATDQGVIKQHLLTQQQTTFPQTEKVIHGGDRLFTYGQGLIALNEQRLIYLTV